MKKLPVLISTALFFASLAMPGQQDPGAPGDHFRKRAEHLEKESAMLDKLKTDGIASRAMENYSRSISELASLYEQISSSVSKTGKIPEDLKKRASTAEKAKSEAAAEFHYQREAQRIRTEIESGKLAELPRVREAGESLLRDLEKYHAAKKALAGSRENFDTAKRDAWEEMRRKKQQEIKAAKAEIEKGAHAPVPVKKDTPSRNDEAAFCTSCGTKVSTGDAFCRKCGERLQKEKNR